ncbi:hypothetical protein M758_UG237100 [Ceratodon purpureus]|nr:hypothetical protein M758_UG237100 [Ceratodon purpureus]
MMMGTQEKGLYRLDAIKQAIILFVHSKLMANAHHRFPFPTLRNLASWDQRLWIWRTTDGPLREEPQGLHVARVTRQARRAAFGVPI